MPHDFRRHRKSIGVQSSVDRETIRQIRRFTDADPRRLSRTQSYRNLVGDIISVVPDDEVTRDVADCNTRGTQTMHVQSSVDYPKPESFARARRNLSGSSRQPRGSSGSDRSKNVESQSLASELVEEALTVVAETEFSLGPCESGEYNVETERAGSGRRSNEETLTREDYRSYDVRNAAHRQESTSEILQDEDYAKTSCCKRKRRSLSILTRPVPIVVEEISKKDSIVSCRICHEGFEIEPLIQPCLCKGTVGNVHAVCLKNWLEQSNTNRCELCNYPYAIRQTKKYKKSYSVKVFFKMAINKRTFIYDFFSFLIITPLALAGVAICAQGSVTTTQGPNAVQIANITKIGMIMLCGIILLAYSIWLLTLVSSYYKAWKKWYEHCIDVEVLPVRMTSEDRREAQIRFLRERDRNLSRDHNTGMYTVLQAPANASTFNITSSRYFAFNRSQRRLTNLPYSRNATT